MTISVLLCAGFATRIYPLTRDVPKPLLDVAGRPVLDYLVDQLLGLSHLKEVHLVTNARFAGHFEEWQRLRRRRFEAMGKSLILHNDGAVDNDRRLGACRDLQLVLHAGGAAHRYLVSAGDNIYRFDIKPLWDAFLGSGSHHVVALPETDKEKLMQTGVPQFEGRRRVVRLHEKAASPPSKWFCPPLYFLQASARGRLDEFLANTDRADAPGHFIDYLCRTETVSAFKLRAGRLHVGSMESYRQAQRIMGAGVSREAQR